MNLFIFWLSEVADEMTFGEFEQALFWLEYYREKNQWQA